MDLKLVRNWRRHFSKASRRSDIEWPCLGLEIYHLTYMTSEKHSKVLKFCGHLLSAINYFWGCGTETMTGRHAGFHQSGQWEMRCLHISETNSFWFLRNQCPKAQPRFVLPVALKSIENVFDTAQWLALSRLIELRWALPTYRSREVQWCTLFSWHPGRHPFKSEATDNLNSADVMAVYLTRFSSDLLSFPTSFLEIDFYEKGVLE